MKPIHISIILIICPFAFLSAQECNPKNHIDSFKKITQGKIIKEIELNFRKDSVIKFTIQLLKNKQYTLYFGSKNTGNQGIVISYCKSSYRDAKANLRFPINFNVKHTHHCTFQFTYHKDYIRNTCAGAILVEY